MTERYKKLKETLPEIAELVKLFPEGLHGRVFEVLLGEFQGVKPSRQVVTTEPGQIPADELQRQEAPGKKIPKVAKLDENGKLKLTVRIKGLKAKNASDATKRLIYVALRANEMLTNTKTLHWLKDLSPLLRELKLYRLRDVFYKDESLDREGEDGYLVSLDDDARKEADKFIEEIQDKNVVRDWKPKPKSSSKKKTSSKKTKNTGGKDSK